jgi:hypothetical protein
MHLQHRVVAEEVRLPYECGRGQAESAKSERAEKQCKAKRGEMTKLHLFGHLTAHRAVIPLTVSFSIARPSGEDIKQNEQSRRNRVTTTQQPECRRP